MRDQQQQQFKRFFGCSFLSDFTLHISSEPPLTIERGRNDCSQGPGGSEQDPRLPGPSVGEASHDSSSSSSSVSATAGGGDAGLPISLPVHGVVLAAASPYFDTLLRDWKSSSNTLHMVVGEDQVAAAQVLVNFLYTSAVPANLSQHDLLQLLLLADRFDVRRAAAAASRVLGCLSPAALEWSTLTGVWALPDHLFEADEQEPLRVVAWDRLMQLFGDLEDSWATADGRLLWQQLPLRAVTALVASDALAVASENTVFAALASWIAHAQADGSSAGGHGGSKQLAAQDLKLLAASLRLPAMGPTFLSYVALQHDWFRQATDVMALARAAAFAAASPEVRKDIAAHTAATSTAVLAAAAAAAAAGGSASGAAGAVDASGSGGSPCGRPSSCICGGLLEVGSSSAGSSSTSSAGGGGATAGGSASGLMSRCICGLGVSPEQKAQLLALAQASQRPRAVSCQRSCCFPWHVDLAAIKQLHDEVAAAGSRDSRILRSPAHSFAGYEWALQLEITQTRGATGFDGSKPWALGVFLTCQVRVEVPARAAEQPPAAAGAAVGSGGAVFCAGGSDSTGSSSGGAGAGRGAADGPAAVCFPGGGAAACKAAAAGASSSSSSSPQPPLTLQLLDFGFVSTAATIAVREVGGARDKRCEKSWEHAVVRYRASWGWPNYLDVQCTGWDESVFERWVVDGQMHLTANVRVLG